MKTTKPQPKETPIEQAERCFTVVDYSDCMSKDLAAVVVAADKTSRVMQLAILGVASDYGHSGSELDTGDLDLLNDIAGGLHLLCDQAKRLVSGQEVTKPAAKAA